MRPSLFFQASRSGRPRARRRRCSGSFSRSASRLQHRLPDDLLDRRQAVLDLLETRASEGDHAFLEAFSLDLDRGRAGEDELADLLGDLEHFDEGDAALVARVVALLAALALHDLDALRVLRR